MNNNKAFTMSLLMAVGAVILMMSYITSREEEWAKKYGEEEAVVVAKKDINEFQTVEEGMIDIQNVPRDYRAPGYTTNKKDVINSIALVPIRRGEQITSNKIGSLGMRTGLARQVSPGKRAVSLPVTETSGISKLLKPGDRVDIMGVIEPPGSSGKQNQIVKTILQDVPILAVGKYVTSHLPFKEEKDESGRIVRRPLQENDAYSTITVEVEPQNAQIMAFLAGGSGVTIMLSLRNNDDTERVPLNAVGLRDVIGSDYAPTTLPRNPAGR